VKVPRRVRFGLVLGGTVAMLFALSMFGVAGLGGPAHTAATSNAGLATASSGLTCQATVTTTFAPSTIVVHAPMMVHTSVVFAPSDPASCSLGPHYIYLGLPLGCVAGNSATFVCVPGMVGTFHVQTIVLAQNTASMVVDTLVVL
jgi:hypothetical protein